MNYQDPNHTSISTKTIDPIKQILTVINENQGIQASSDDLYKDAIFGRDSIETAEDLLEDYPSIAHSVIISLAKLQGTKYNQITYEEPGRIHHEYRNLFIKDQIGNIIRKVGEKQQKMLLGLPVLGWVK